MHYEGSLRESTGPLLFLYYFTFVPVLYFESKMPLIVMIKMSAKKIVMIKIDRDTTFQMQKWHKQT
jgi:hypothetical protein